MSDKVIVSKSEIDELRTYGELDDMILKKHLIQIINQATPVSGEAVGEIELCSQYGDEISLYYGAGTLAKGTKLYTTPQPAPDTVPVEKYNRAIEALQYWRKECSGYEPSISVFEQKVDKALAEAMKGE